MKMPKHLLDHVDGVALKEFMQQRKIKGANGTKNHKLKEVVDFVNNGGDNKVINEQQVQNFLLDNIRFTKNRRYLFANFSMQTGSKLDGSILQEEPISCTLFEESNFLYVI